MTLQSRSSATAQTEPRSATFSGSGITFHTFYFGSEFSNLNRVEIPTWAWSLDNLVISVPEPSVQGLGLAVATAALFYQRLKARKQESDSQKNRTNDSYDFGANAAYAVSSGKRLLLAAVYFLCLSSCFSQGVITISFDGPPSVNGGVLVQSYTELGFLLLFCRATTVLSVSEVA